MILIVDDHSDSRKVLVRLLQIEGYYALGVEDGNQALTFLRNFRPRLIVLDFGMPNLNGLEVFLEIRKRPELAGIPVIMFSAFDGNLRDQAIAAGVDSYVVKSSLDWSDLRKEIFRLAGPPTPVLPAAECKEEVE